MKNTRLKTALSSLLMSIVLITASCENKQKISAYVFELDEQGIANPDDLTAQYVKPVGNLTTDSYATMLKEPEPKWSRIVIRNRNTANGRTDSVYDLNVSDELRFNVDGGYTTIEKISGSATYVIDVTESGKRSFTLVPRKASDAELAQNVIVTTGIVAAIIGYLIYIL